MRKYQLSRSLFSSILLLLLPPYLSGCATFLGSGRPVEEKAQGYQIGDLARMDADWERDPPPESTLPPEKFSAQAEDVPGPGAESALADRTWKSKRTGSMITLNTICRPSHAILPRTTDTLRDLSQQLFLGLGDIKLSDELEIQLQGVRALQRTTEGAIQDTPGKVRRVKMRTVTLLHGECLFDILLASAPSNFTQDEGALQKLLTSLRLPALENP